MRKTNEFSNRLEYRSNNHTYKEWADATWKAGFSLPVSDVCNALKVSERWLRDNYYNFGHYVLYSQKYVYDKTGKHKNKVTYISQDEFIDWVLKTGKFEKQTEVIDLYNYLYLADKKKANKIFELYKETFKRLGDFYNRGTIPESVFCVIRREFNLHSDISKNAVCTKRKEYPWIEVEAFNPFERDYYFVEGDISPEIIYREAFLRGDIKITLGKGRVMFVKNKTDIEHMKMPLIVKANARAIVI